MIKDPFSTVARIGRSVAVISWCGGTQRNLTVSASYLNFREPSANTKKARKCSSSKITSTVSWNFPRHLTLLIQWSHHRQIWRIISLVSTKQSKIATCSALAATSEWISKNRRSFVWNWSLTWSQTMCSAYICVVKQTRSARKLQIKPYAIIKKRMNWP